MSIYIMDRGLEDVYLIAVHYTVYSAMQRLLSHLHHITAGPFTGTIIHTVAVVYWNNNHC